MKSPDEMEIGEFISWATGYILVGLGGGEKLRDLVSIVVQLSIQNKVFGKNKT